MKMKPLSVALILYIFDVVNFFGKLILHNDNRIRVNNFNYRHTACLSDDNRVMYFDMVENIYVI